MKPFLLLFLSVFIYSCSTNEPPIKETSTSSPNQSTGCGASAVIIPLTNNWELEQTIYASYSTYLYKEMVVGDKTFHHISTSTGYQTLNKVIEVGTAPTVPEQIIQLARRVANTPSLIANVSVGTLNYWATNPIYKISTTLYDSTTKKWINYSQEIPFAQSNTSITASGDDLFIATRNNISDPISTWKWNNNTKLWEILIKDYQPSKTWYYYDIYPGLPGEFVIKEKGANENKIHFHVFNGTTVTDLYDKAHSSSQAFPYYFQDIFPFQNKYLVNDGNVGFITSDKKIQPLKDNFGGGRYGTRIIGDKIFMLDASNTINPSVVEATTIVVYDHGSCKYFNLGGKNLVGPQNPSDWQFRVYKDKVELLANMNNGVNSNGGITYHVKLFSIKVDF